MMMPFSTKTMMSAPSSFVPPYMPLSSSLIMAERSFIPNFPYLSISIFYLALLVSFPSSPLTVVIYQHNPVPFHRQGTLGSNINAHPVLGYRTIKKDPYRSSESSLLFYYSLNSGYSKPSKYIYIDISDFSLGG